MGHTTDPMTRLKTALCIPYSPGGGDLKYLTLQMRLLLGKRITVGPKERQHAHGNDVKAIVDGSPGPMTDFGSWARSWRSARA